MATASRSPCNELVLKGERLCRVEEYADGIKCFEKALDLGTDDLNILSAIYSQLGSAYLRLGNLTKAIEFYHHDCTLAQSTNDLLGEAKANSNLCSTYKMMGKYDEAILCSQQQLEVSRKLSNKSSEAQALYNMGNVYHVKAKQKCKSTSGSEQQDPKVTTDLKIALLCYIENLDIVRELGDKALEGRVCGSIGNVHYLLGNCLEAVKFHTERLAVAKEFGDKEAQRRAYTNLGNCHILLANYEQASQFYFQTLSISRQLNDRAFEAQACYSLGSTYTLLADYSKVIEYHLRHKKLAEELNDRIGMARACWLLSNAYSSLGNYSKALEFTQEQLLISTEIGDKPGVLTAERSLKELTVFLHNDKTEKPRVRRRSMEHMQLLSLTPEQALTMTPDNNATTSKANNKSSDICRNLFDASRQGVSTGVELRNGNSTHGPSNHSYPRNERGDGPSQRKCGVVFTAELITTPRFGSHLSYSVVSLEKTLHNDYNLCLVRFLILNQQQLKLNEGRKSMTKLRWKAPSTPLRDNKQGPSPDKFFDLIMLLQGRRMDDQRVEMKEDENDAEPPRAQNDVAVEPVIADQLPHANHDDQEDNHEKMNFMISMLAHSQSKRLNEQRVSLNSLPGVRSSPGCSNPSVNNQAPPPVPAVADNGNNEIEENVFELDDNFLENLMRCQGTRLNDQRTAAPNLESFAAPTIPDEDFICLIVRMQSSRIEDQRCHFDPDDP